MLCSNRPLAGRWLVATLLLLLLQWQQPAKQLSFFVIGSPVDHHFDDEALLPAARRLMHGYISNLLAPSSAGVVTMLQQEIQAAFDGVISASAIEMLRLEAMELLRSRQHENKAFFADRYVHAMLDIAADPDCRSREFDASVPFDFEAASRVLHKCRLLVVRNALNTTMLDAFKLDNLTHYINGIHRGKVSMEGRTLNNEDHIINDSAENRWEIILPFQLLQPAFIHDPNITEILSHDAVLGPDLTLHSYGMYLSTPGAPAQNWHQDDTHLFGDAASVASVGIGAADLPLHAVTIMIPLVSMTAAQGPTEFCMGSHALGGLDLSSNLENLQFRDESLRSNLHHFNQFRRQGACPPGMWRAPTLNYGDVALFDYTIRHRGGANRSPKARTAIFATLSRFWYKDGIFNEADEGEDEEEDDSGFPHHLLRAPRLAIPSGWNGDASWRKLLKESSKRQPIPLEEFTNLLQGYTYSQESEIDGILQHFVVSNVGVPAPCAGQTLVLRISRRDELTSQEFPFHELTSVLVDSYPGDELVVVTSDGAVVHTWEVDSDQEQLVLSTMNSSSACLTSS